MDWNEPLLYDLVLSTERLNVPAAVRLIREALATERFRSTPESRAVVRDLGLAARARATLLKNPRTQELDLTVACPEGVVVLSGRVACEEERGLAGAVTEGIAGAGQVRNEIVVMRTRSGVERSSERQPPGTATVDSRLLAHGFAERHAGIDSLAETLFVIWKRTAVVASPGCQPPGCGRERRLMGLPWCPWAGSPGRAFRASSPSASHSGSLR